MCVHADARLINWDIIWYFHFTNRILYSFFRKLHLGISKLEVKKNFERVNVAYGSSPYQSPYVFYDLFWSCLLIDIKRTTLKFHSEFYFDIIFQFTRFVNRVINNTLFLCFRWRTKQNLDYAFMMLYCSHIGTLYVQVGTGYMVLDCTITNYALMWLQTALSSIGTVINLIPLNSHTDFICKRIGSNNILLLSIETFNACYLVEYFVLWYPTGRAHTRNSFPEPGSE